MRQWSFERRPRISPLARTCAFSTCPILAGPVVSCKFATSVRSKACSESSLRTSPNCTSPQYSASSTSVSNMASASLLSSEPRIRRNNRTLFSARSLYRPAQNRFSAARLETVRCLRARSAGCIGEGNSEKVEIGWLDSTQVSTLLPPNCIDTVACRSAARRVKPPGITCQPPLKSAMAYTRSTDGRRPSVPSS